ncbi:MAG TPA: cation:proton antiporter [Thermoplasmata archaeon]|nr:cation:proton antiporter [Thermoplasmata archaeon]
MDILLSLLILLATARFLGEVVARAKLPSLVGEILAGVLLGPAVLGLLAADATMTLLANLGIFFLVYLAALELTLEDVKRSIRDSGIYIAVGAFTVPMLAGTALGGMIGLGWTSAMFLGIALAFTAVPVLARILTELDLLRTALGRSLISAALLCDVAGLSCIGLLLNLNGPAGVDLWSTVVLLLKFGVFVGALLSIDRMFRVRHGALGAWLLRASRHFLTKESAFAMPFLVALGFAFLADLLSLHFVVGAFFGTLLLSEHVIVDRDAKAVRSATSAMTLGLFGPVFFAFIGLALQIGSLGNVTLVAAVLGVASASKLLGGYIGARWSRMPHRLGLAIGIGMNGRGAMELVVATIGLELGLIDSTLFSILVLTGVVTTLMTPFGLRAVLREAPEEGAEAHAAPGRDVGRVNGGT